MLEKLNRLREMSNAEVMHRLRERWRQRTDRARWYCGTSERDAELDNLIRSHDSSIKTYLRQGPARRFYSSTQDREKTAQFVVEHFPEWLDRTIREGMRLSEHRLNLLGYENVTLGQNINWHCDPISGYQWPRKYWADYDLVHGAAADAKVIHELNRHQQLPRLAKAFCLTGDELYAREAVGQMGSWIDQNAKWNGVNWQSSLELAIRSISWMWTVFLLLPSESLDEENLRRICKSLFSQLDHVYRYPSVYTSPNTHLIGEATALFMGGLLFQELPRAERWYRFGTATLVNEFQRQVSNEGVYAEASSYYHCYATDFYLQALALARWNRLTLSEWMWTRLEQMIEFVMHISRPDGSLPLMGDDDGGRALALSLEDYSSFSDSLSSGAVLFGRTDFKSLVEFREESLWLLGTEGWQVFNSLQPQPPMDLSRAYLDSGLFVQRSGWSDQDSHVVFDCGNLGMQTGGHGHADALSLTLFTGGRDILIDPGTSVYNGAPEWRNFFRSTRAHNTVVVDGHSQSQPSGSFSWKQKAKTRVLKNISLPEFEYVDGEHDGYAALPKDIGHRRRVIYIRPNYWIVLDDLRGRGEHNFDFLYHFASDVELFIFGDEPKGEVECRARIEDTGLQMFMYGSAPLRADAICGQVGPIQGWASRRYGERHPSPVLRASMRGSAPVSMMTFLMPGTAATQSRRFNGNSNQAIAAVIRNGEYDDVAVMSMQEGELHFNDCVMRGEFFWMRLHNGNLQRLVAVNAQSFSYGGETVIESRQAIPYAQAYFWEDGIVIERGEREGKVYVRDLRDRQFQRN
jgi:hypothetical protein